MFCQKCGKENSDDAAFFNSCGANLTKKSALNTAYINSKENEIRLLQEKFGNETLQKGPTILVFVIIILYLCFWFISGSPTNTGLAIVVVLFSISIYWRYSMSEAAKKTEIDLYAA